jgi:hypothetical protein
MFLKFSQIFELLLFYPFKWQQIFCTLTPTFYCCLEIIVHRAISSSLDVIALFGIDQEQQDKLVQPCIAAIRYAEAACSSGTFELIHISSSVRVPRRQDLFYYPMD